MNRTILTFSLASFAALAAATTAYALLNRPDDRPVATVSPITVGQVKAFGLRAGIIQLPESATITIAKPAEVLSFKVGESSLQYRAVGAVEAAVNLSELNEGDIAKGETGIVITLPAPALTLAWIDPDLSHPLERKQAFVFAPEDKDFQSQAEQKARERFIQTACAGGILQKSADNAKTAVLTFLHQLGVVNVRVEVKEPKECVLKETDHV